MRPGLRRLIPALAAVGAIALFTALGFWQLDRAQFKQALTADFARRDDARPRVVESAAELGSLSRFVPVSVTGRFLPGRQIYLDNRIRDGRPGIEVFTPFELTGGDTLLVNRGWLPFADRRRALPPAPAPGRTVTLRGLVAAPPAPGLRLGKRPATPEWPWLTPWLTIADAEAVLERPLADRVLLLGADQPHGFRRDWQPVTMPSERHLGYAFQWFALAVAVAVIWIVLTRRGRRPGLSSGPGGGP